MSEIRIEQFAGMALDHKGFMQMPELPPTGNAITLASGATSNVSGSLDPKTRCVRVRCIGTPGVAFRLGDSAVADPVALTTDTSLDDGEVAWFGIHAGWAGKSTLKIAVIDR
jgi:hypothetical protein